MFCPCFLVTARLDGAEWSEGVGWIGALGNRLPGARPNAARKKNCGG